MASSRRFLVATLLALAATVQLARANTVLDVIQWGLEYISGESEPATSRDSGRQCSCDGPSCMCCMGFNFTYVDLGGPGCVKLNYLSQDEGLTVNVSYGNSLLHSEQVKGPEPKSTCLDLFTDLVQMCAHITEFSARGEGLRGCVALEPTILGDPQAQYPMGCFLMGTSGMSLDKDNPVPRNITEAVPEEEEEEEEEGTTAENETERPDASEEAFIAVVNETAEESISWLSSLLGLSFGGGAASKPASSTASLEETTTTAASQTNQQQRNLNNDIR